MGSAKAAVLPVPVWAMPWTSLALHDEGDRLDLDGGGGGVTLGDERLEKGCCEAEFVECGDGVMIGLSFPRKGGPTSSSALVADRAERAQRSAGSRTGAER